MSELARNTLTETKQRNQIEDKIDGDLKEAWQAAIAWSIIIMVVGIQVIILYWCHNHIEIKNKR
ncbi:hypothetical protein [Limosilactobacillus reuteri]|uniref:hypothetical protein n=1 Tax=Limosilactobacillus reuteri TaxID=1598 RepID=UPI001E32D9F4|nr:hypothetical protein [Limosilactobacillus reuteri]MCC4487006.1 hypothetical protein [Limosilactobacillus reuteri]